MLKKTVTLFICLFIATAAFAFDCDKFYKALDTYSTLSNHADELLKEAKETWKFDAYERAMDRSDAASEVVFKMISKLRKVEDIKAAKVTIEKFEKASPKNQQVAREARKVLRDRVKYLSSISSIFDFFKKK